MTHESNRTQPDADRLDQLEQETFQILVKIQALLKELAKTLA